MTTGYLSIDILKVVLFELKIFVNNLKYHKKILHSGRIILLKEVARFSIQMEVVYFKSGIGDIWKMIATGSIEKKSHTVLFIVSSDCDLDPF